MPNLAFRRLPAVPFFRPAALLLAGLSVSGAVWAQVPGAAGATSEVARKPDGDAIQLTPALIVELAKRFASNGPASRPVDVPCSCAQEPSSAPPPQSR